MSAAAPQGLTRVPIPEPDALDREGRPVSVYAGAVTRLAAFLIDVVIVVIMILFVSGVVALVAAIIPGTQNLGVAGFVTGFFFFVMLAGTYGVLSWVVDGSTPGMAIMRIKVVSIHGGPPTTAQSIRRAIGLVIAFIPFGLGFLGILTNEQRRGWHDRFARTVVLYAPDAARKRAFREPR